MIVSKAKHINPITGYEVPDEALLTHGLFVTEDADNIYVTGWDGVTETFSKERWELR